MSIEKTVFIIDDDEVIVFLTRRVFELAGYDKITFRHFLSVESALNNLCELHMNNQKLPDLIMFDLNLPGEDGWSFIDAFSLLKFAADIPCVVFSSSVNPQDIARAKKWNPLVRDFICKPVDFSNCKKIIDILQNPGYVVKGDYALAK